MPVLFLETLPLPTLKTYSNISLALFLCTLCYAYHVAIDQAKSIPISVQQFAPVDEGNGSDASSGVEEHWVISPHDLAQGIFHVLTEETWCVWVLVNTAYCMLILTGKLIQHLIFGELRVAEAQHLKDRFWNFVFYKFIFIFGVLNVQHLGEVLTWGAWFSILGFLHHLSQLSKDRFEYLSFSPTTPRFTHIQVLSLLVSIFLIACGLMGLCIQVGLFSGDLNTFGFMAAECSILLLKTMYVIARYSIHLWDINQEGTWERRGTFVYYAELIFELAALSFDFIHHLHMLIWSNIFLSMASLVICMQLRFLFYEIQRRLRRHKNYLRVIASMEARYPMASKEDLEQHAKDGGDDSCAICWDSMETARRLPCGHYFHNSCLRSWLEQDVSCPTCRTSLQEGGRSEATSNDNTAHEMALPGQASDAGGNTDANSNTRPPHNPTPQRNHFFHFDGSRYVSWLPSFSVAVTHSLSLGGDPPPIPTSQVESMAREVMTIFPHMPMDIVIADLQITRSVDLTADNILEGRLQPPPHRPSPQPDASMAQPSLQRNVFTEQALDHADFYDSYDIIEGMPSSSVFSVIEDDSDDGSIQLRQRRPVTPTEVPPMSDPSPLRPAVSHPELTAEHNAASLPTSVSDPIAFDSVDATTSVEAVGGRFSKSSTERESILHQRKSLLMQQAKKRFLSRQSGETSTISRQPEKSEKTE